MGRINATTVARLRQVAAAALASPVAGPIIAPCTITIMRNGVAVLTGIPAHVRAPNAMQINADGGSVIYDVEAAPGLAVRQGIDLLVITTCPSNPAMVTASATGWSVSAVRQEGGLITKTCFRATQKVQP